MITARKLTLLSRDGSIAGRVPVMVRGDELPPAVLMNGDCYLPDPGAPATYRETSAYRTLAHSS